MVSSLLLDFDEGRSNPGVYLKGFLPVDPGKVDPISLMGFSLLSTLPLIAGFMISKA